MTLTIASVIITTLIVAGAFGPSLHPVAPTEIKVKATDATLSEIYLDIGDLNIVRSHPNGRDCVYDGDAGIEGIEISEIIDILKDEYGICVKTIPLYSDGEHNSVPISFNRDVGVGVAPGKGIATVNYSGMYGINQNYIRTERVSSPAWSPYGCITSIDGFNITLITSEC